MSFRIRCHVLFDITPSGNNRRHPDVGEDVAKWTHNRNTQSNFDTILQVISLRSQPEVVRNPELTMIKFDQHKFGFLFEQHSAEEYPCWSFDFEIQHLSVFDNGISELGLLNLDCHQVPMIKCGTEWDKLSVLLDTSDELRNIYFEPIL